MHVAVLHKLRKLEQVQRTASMCLLQVRNGVATATENRRSFVCRGTVTHGWQMEGESFHSSQVAMLRADFVRSVVVVMRALLFFLLGDGGFQKMKKNRGPPTIAWIVRSPQAWLERWRHVPGKAKVLDRSSWVVLYDLEFGQWLAGISEMAPEAVGPRWAQPRPGTSPWFHVQASHKAAYASAEMKRAAAAASHAAVWAGAWVLVEDKGAHLGALMCVYLTDLPVPGTAKCEPSCRQSCHDKECGSLSCHVLALQAIEGLGFLLPRPSAQRLLPTVPWVRFSWHRHTLLAPWSLWSTLRRCSSRRVQCRSQGWLAARVHVNVVVANRPEVVFHCLGLLFLC